MKYALICFALLLQGAPVQGFAPQYRAKQGSSSRFSSSSAAAVGFGNNKKIVPKIEEWKLCPEDGTVRGVVTGHPVLKDGEEIRTDPLIIEPDFEKAGKGGAIVVTTVSGSEYELQVSSAFSSSAAPTGAALKEELLRNIAALKRLQDEDGKIAVDFGVKGGEIDEKSRAPRKLDFYSVSERVGKAADDIFRTVEELSKVNPTAAATAGFGGRAGAGDEQTAPLDGTWRLLFSTAADASFSRDSKRGDAEVSNVVDARRGRITNVIKFAPKEDGKPKAVEEFRVKLSAKSEGPNRIDLVFRYVALKFTKLFFLPLRWTLYIPVPSPTIARFVVGVTNLKNRLFRRNKKEVRKLPKAYFDVLYLDKDLRVHKTGEDNLFIQGRPEWKNAWEMAG